MKTGWAPWRMEYIKGKKPRGCVFCRCPRSKKNHYLLFRGRWNFVILNRYPYNNGHLMVIPYRHLSEVEKLTEPESAEMFQLMKKSVRALRRAMKPEGFNVGMNLGKSAGAGIAGHLHLHIVPRWQADTNFMPVLAEAKFLPQHLRETWNSLNEAWRDR